MKNYFLTLLIIGALAFDVKDLTEEIYLQKLQNKHIFIIACIQNDELCDKFYKDFKKEWL